MALADNFISNLRAACEKAGMTQRELASRSGVHFVTINRLFQGRHAPTLAICEDLAKAAGLDPEKSFRPARNRG